MHEHILFLAIKYNNKVQQSIHKYYLLSDIYKFKVLGRNSQLDILSDRGGGTPGKPPPWGPNSFIFMVFSAKKLHNNMLANHFDSWRPSQENPGSATIDTYFIMFLQVK